MIHHRPKVLVVEDTKSWQVLLKHQLEKAGYECAVESNALGAISHLGWEDFDVVVLDWELKLWSPESVEEMVKRRGIPACYFTAHNKSELSTDLPVIEKEGRGLQRLIETVSSLIGLEQKAAYS